MELPLTPDNVIPPEVVTLSVSLMQATNAKMTLIVGTQHFLYHLSLVELTSFFCTSKLGVVYFNFIFSQWYYFFVLFAIYDHDVPEFSQEFSLDSPSLPPLWPPAKMGGY